ncbi:hypothetical protein L2E82_35926 [Cichorium intybus]|uniref:Uncharacterized protein n=1 Tax=Cichorium intybus TaxID=13427 RepID=A0ACB9BQ88_CICIN|nr:hypothetical protein L2E82_35926 [Cichorium intybus]
MDVVGEDDVHEYSPKGKFSHRSKSVSISIPVTYKELNSGEVSLVAFTDYDCELNAYEWNDWKQDKNSSACFSEDGFNYGIYVTAVNLTTDKSLLTRYVYSSFWGLQQISTLGGNQTPSYFVGEVLFTMGIIGLGLLLFALLIGNMQNFLQGLGRRRLEKSLRRRDVEEWMSHRRLPAEIRRKVRESEHYNWVATRGVDEETLMENLPEDLQRDIRRHLFKFIKKVRIFARLNEPILDAICEKLRQKTYIKGGTILYEGGFVTKMIFIVRGKMESIEKNGTKFSLLEGDVCGEELLKWCLEDTRNQRKQGNKLLSNRTVKCLKNVEAFVLRAEDLEKVITLYDGFFKNHRIQFAIRSRKPTRFPPFSATQTRERENLPAIRCDDGVSKQTTTSPSSPTSLTSL